MTIKSKIVAMAMAVFLLTSVGKVQAKSDIKIALVDVKKVFDEFSGAKSAKKTLESATKAKEDDLDSRTKELSSLQKDYMEKKLMMSEEGKKKKEKDLQKKYLDLQSLQAQYKKDLEAKEQALIDDIRVQITKVVKSLAESRGYDAVLEKSTAFYGGEDITEDVVKSLEAGSK